MTIPDDDSRISRRSMLAAGASVAGLGVAGCLEADEQPGNTELSAVAGSFFMLYDLSRNVAGDQLRIEDLVPAGAHGDDWEPNPGIIEDVAESDAFVYIDGFRSWSDNVAGALPQDYPDVTVIDAADGIDHIEGEQGRDIDPHFWMDPTLAQEAVENIHDGFAEADPDNADAYEENAAAFVERLDDVHEQYEAVMDRRERDRIVVGSHNSFEYWRERYDIEIHSPVGISPDGEPTPQEMEEITGIIEDNDLNYVLYDKYEPDDYAVSIAEQTGAETLPLSPIEATTEEQLADGMGYVEHMLDINLATLERALEVPEE